MTSRRQAVLLIEDDARLAAMVAEYLGRALERNIAWALPRRPYKDVREQVVAGEWDRGLDVETAKR